MTEGIKDGGAALNALLAYHQADMDGIIVTTSRQAIHEVADELTALRAVNSELAGALDGAQKILAILTDPAAKGSGINSINVWANCVSAEKAARTALARHRGEKE